MGWGQARVLGTRPPPGQGWAEPPRCLTGARGRGPLQGPALRGLPEGGREAHRGGGQPTWHRLRHAGEAGQGPGPAEQLGGGEPWLGPAWWRGPGTPASPPPGHTRPTMLPSRFAAAAAAAAGGLQRHLGGGGQVLRAPRTGRWVSAHPGPRGLRSTALPGREAGRSGQASWRRWPLGASRRPWGQGRLGWLGRPQPQGGCGRALGGHVPTPAWPCWGLCLSSPSPGLLGWAWRFPGPRRPWPP